MNRQDLLRLATLSAVPMSLLQTRSARAAGTTELGCPVPVSGPLTVDGEFADLGMKLVMEQYGEVLGRPLACSVFDTEGKPAMAMCKVQRLTQQKNACYSADDALSSESLAVDKEAERPGEVFITTAGIDEVTGEDYNHAIFC